MVLRKKKGGGKYILKYIFFLMGSKRSTNLIEVCQKHTTKYVAHKITNRTTYALSQTTF